MTATMDRLRHYLPLIAGLLLFLLPTMLATHSCANTTEAPSGGDKDTIPPYITDIVPLPGATGVPLTGMTFVFTFNEYVEITNTSNIFLSPPTGKTTARAGSTLRRSISPSAT